MTDPLSDLSEDQLATDTRIGMRRLTFEFLLQQEYFGPAVTMVTEYNPNCVFESSFQWHQSALRQNIMPGTIGFRFLIPELMWRTDQHESV